MSLTAKSSTDKENIKALFRNYTGLVLLQDHAKPSNYTEVVNAIHDRFETKEQNHLLCADFNQTATSTDSESKMVKLQALRDQQATTLAATTGTKTTKTTTSKSSTAGIEQTAADVAVKQEPSAYHQLGIKSADQWHSPESYSLTR